MNTPGMNTIRERVVINHVATVDSVEYRQVRSDNICPWGWKKVMVMFLMTVLMVSCHTLPATLAPGIGVTGTGEKIPEGTSKAVQVPVTPKPQSNTTSSPGVTSTTVIDPAWVNPKDGRVMIYVPAGKFSMGSVNGEADEKPQHDVTLSAFWIDRMEVTNAMFQKFAEANHYQTDAEKQGNAWAYNLATANWEDTGGANWLHPWGMYSDIQGKEDHPVVNVSWNDAMAYCQWVGERLPTEAEWEKAARGIDGGIYPWGEGIDCENANFFSKKKNKSACAGDTTSVGIYPKGASPYGVLDMAGNVWEWVADWYGDSYYESSPSENPVGPSNGQYRVLRGGSWLNYDHYIRVTIRNRYHPDSRLNHLGFRCALSP